MKKQIIFSRLRAPFVKILMTGLILIPTAQTSLAIGAGTSEKTQHSLQQKNENTSSWAKWLLTQVMSLPSFQAMEKGVLVASEQQNAMQQSVYNPELGAFYTDKDDDEYGMMVSQTIDWFDKRSANSQLGQNNYDLVLLENHLKIETSLSQALLAYIEFSMSKQLLDISQQQEALLTKLSADLKRREAAGDVGQTDAEMAYLSLSQNLQQISLTEIRYRRASAQITQSIGSSVVVHPKSSIWFNHIDGNEVSKYLDNGYKILYAQKQLDESVSQSKIALLNKKVNPTIGLGAGRDGDENTILFEISVPLNVRNTFSSEYSAALHKVNQIEFELQEEQRLVKNDIEQSFNNYTQLKTRVVSWQKLTENRLKQSEKLLKRQWKSGDISTSDYLFALRQRTDALIANIELKGEMQKAWVEWLLASSQVNSWLKNLNEL